MKPIELLETKFQDNFAVKQLQNKVNELIEAFNKSCTPQVPENKEQ